MNWQQLENDANPHLLVHLDRFITIRAEGKTLTLLASTGALLEYGFKSQKEALECFETFRKRLVE